MRNVLSLAYMPRARACYLDRSGATRALRDLTGRVRLALDVVRGEVERATIESSTLDQPEVEACLREGAFAIDVPRAWRSDAAVTAILNMNFRPLTPEKRAPDLGEAGDQIDLLIEEAQRQAATAPAAKPATAPAANCPWRRFRRADPGARRSTHGGLQVRRAATALPRRRVHRRDGRRRPLQRLRTGRRRRSLRRTRRRRWARRPKGPSRRSRPPPATATSTPPPLKPAKRSRPAGSIPGAACATTELHRRRRARLGVCGVCGAEGGLTMPSVAVVGASSVRDKFGNKAVRAYLRQGWTVYPVNPTEKTVEGLTALPDDPDIPGPVDRVSMYVPPSVGLTLLDGIKAKAPKELFFNPGSESDELIARAESLGLDPIQACSIVDIGERPSSYR